MHDLGKTKHDGHHLKIIQTLYLNSKCDPIPTLSAHAVPTLILQPNPPQYNVSELSVHTALFSGSRDWLADKRDVDNLIPKISNTVFNHTNIASYEHLDFIWGLNARYDVYDVIIKMTQQFM